MSKIILLGLILVFFSFAQEKKEAAQKDVDVKEKPEQKEEPLPKIALPEFVITGNEKIDLNIKSKAEEDEERVFVPERPAPGTRSMEFDGPISQKQVKQFSQVPSGMNGKIFAGFGFYQSPQFDGWFGQYDQLNSFIINGNYSSSEGHLDKSIASWWKGGMGARARYVMPESSSVLPYMQLNGDLQYARDYYHEYGSKNPTQMKNLSLFDLSIGLGSRYALPYKSLSGFDYTGNIGVRSFSAVDDSSSTETDFFIGGVATTRFLSAALRGQIEYRMTSYSMSIPNTQLGHWFLLKGEAQTLVLPSMQMTAAIQQFIFRGNVAKAGGRFFPQLEFRYFITESATMYVGFDPTVERTSLESLNKNNRYSKTNSEVQPTIAPVSIFTGMEFAPMDELTATAKFSYKHFDKYPTFLDTNGAKVWEVSYLSDVRLSKVDVSLVYKLNQQQNITAYLSTTQVKQKNSSSTLPYIPAFSVGTVYHHFFDNGIHLEALAEYVGSRYTDIANTDSLKNSGYLFTSVKGEMKLFDRFQGYIEIQNLLNQKYYIWDGYQERTIYLLAGVSYQW